MSFAYQGGGGRVHKFGFNPVATTSWEPIWDQGGIYTWPDAGGEAMFVASTDVNDTNDGGTGARHVHVTGILADGSEFIEEVLLDGQTPVALVNTNVRALSRSFLHDAGSSGVNAGDIYLGNGTFTDGVPVNKFLKITAGNGQTLHGLYSSPAGKTVRLLSYNAFGARSGATDVDFRIRFRIDRGPWRVIVIMPSSQIQLTSAFAFPITLGTGQIDIMAEAMLSTGSDPAGVEMCIAEE